MSNYDHKSRKLNENKRRSNSRSLQSSLENISDESRSPARSRSPLERHDKQRSYKPNDRIHQNHHPNKILAIFGLDLDARKFDLYKIYDRYGCVGCKVIINRKTGRSRGFGFVYFKTTKEAIEAKYATENKTILNRKIRIDYSMETASHFYDQARGSSQDFYQSSRQITRDRYRPEERSEPRQSYNNRFEKSNSKVYESHIPRHSSGRYSSSFSERYHRSLFKRSRYS